MNLSMKWLSDYIDVDCDIKDFVAGMTMSGSKVEGYEEESENISNVVVGKILEIANHENADSLFVCQVEVGKESPIQIVTNAKNVKVGDFVPVALDGATLPDGKIKKGKLRGVESFGMFCGLETLGLTLNDFPYADKDGVLVIETEQDYEEIIIGQDIKEALAINDTSVEFEITSNRPDCLSVIGLAREAYATFNKPLDLREPKFNSNSENVSDYISVDVQNKELCCRYMAGIVKNVKIGPSPRWIRERLRASGVRPINNFVDITNFVMLEYGHPMHAFDMKYVEDNNIVVRNAKNDEKITTLDGIERTLSDEMLVIADGKKPIAVAGVMGGEYSGIMDDTTTVVFEAACFNGASVRKTAKKLGMRTDSSARFEKGLDAQNAHAALMRAFELVEILGCGEIVGNVIDIDNSDKTLKSVEFDYEWTNKFLGTNIPENDQIEYLNRLGFVVEDGKVIYPSVRIDIECKQDVAEEVARIYGYNNINSTHIKGIAQAKLTDEQIFENKIQNSMVSLGYNQILTYSFTTPKHFDKINLPKDSVLRNAVKIMNPLGEDTSVMRTTAIPSMLEILSRNYNFRNETANLFEISTEYHKKSENELPDEPKMLVVGAYGEDYDFFNIKGDVVKLLEVLKISDYEIMPFSDKYTVSDASAFHTGRRAVIIKDDEVIGYLGEIHPVVLKNYEIGTRAYVAKISLPKMMEVRNNNNISYKPLPKFPATTRDLSLICDEKLPVAEIEKAIKKGCGKILENIKLFDVYQGKQIEDGKKSIAYTIVMRSHDSTLTDEQADKAISKVLTNLQKINVSIRQ